MLLQNGAHAAPCASAVPCRRLSLSRLPSRPSFFTQLAEPSEAESCLKEPLLRHP